MKVKFFHSFRIEISKQ